jgi:hypothetical protein
MRIGGCVYGVREEPRYVLVRSKWLGDRREISDVAEFRSEAEADAAAQKLWKAGDDEFTKAVGG